MQTNIELADASGQMLALPVSARRERRSALIERSLERGSLFTLVKEARRSAQWENVVWIGIAIAALVLLVMSFEIRLSPPGKERKSKRHGAAAVHNVADGVARQNLG